MSCVLLYDAESKMGDARLLCQTDLLKFNGLRANILEQSDSFAEEYRDQVYFDLIEPSGFDELLDGTRTTYHPNIFVAGCGFRLR